MWQKSANVTPNEAVCKKATWVKIQHGGWPPSSNQ